MADVHDVFDQQDALYVNFLCGVQIERTGELYRYDEPSGPFISFIERRIGQPKTVFQSFRHAHSQRYADLLNIVGPPRWMQILHGSNLANSVRGLRARPEPYEADFPIDLPFERHVTTSQYLRQRTRSAFDLARLWLLHPYFAREFVRARRLRRAGTMILPQSSSVGEQARYPEWVMRTGRPVVRAVRALDTAWRRRRGHRSNNAR